MGRSILWMVLLILWAFLMLVWAGAIDVHAEDPEPPNMDYHISPIDVARPYLTIDEVDAQVIAAMVGECVSEDPFSGCVPPAYDLVPSGTINVLDLQAVMNRLGCDMFDDCYWPEVLQ